MSTTSHTIGHHSLFEEQDQIPTQMGFFPFSSNLTLPPLGCHQSSLKAFNSITTPSSLPISQQDSSTSNLTQTLFHKSREHLTSTFGGPQFLSLHRSTLNPWSDNSLTFSINILLTVFFFSIKSTCFMVFGYD